MIDEQMFSKTLQRLISAKGIGVIHRCLSRMGHIMLHQRLRRDILNDFSVNSAIPLQQTEYNVFACGTTTPFTFTHPTKVALIQFNFTRQLNAFNFCRVKQDLTQALVNTGGNLDIPAQINCQAIGWLLLIKPCKMLVWQRRIFKTFLIQAVRAFHIPTTCLGGLKRTTKYTLSTIQIVGRTTENTLAASIHRLSQEYLSYVLP